MDELVTVAEPQGQQAEHGNIKIKVKIEAFEPCPIHGPLHEPCDCPKVSAGVREQGDLGTAQLAEFIQALILATTETITDTGGTGRSIANATATSAVTIAAGTGTNAATVTDTNMQTQTETVSGTVNAYSGSGSSGSFTVTGTITAGANRAYAEVGLIITCSTHTFLLCHDSFSVLNVSNGGTLAVTYTFTIS